MEQVYALGISCIEFIQYWFKDWKDYFLLVNHIFNPNVILENVLPFLAAVDSVFAAQFLLCMSFGTWLNAIMKWWLLEDRPYWWVQETTFYDNNRPHLHQYYGTCETGPGAPSGHSSTAASVLMLFIMWISHILNDWNYNVWWYKYFVYPFFGAMLVSVMLGRLFVAAHFPHQVLLGGLVGSVLSPALCIYVSDPYIWKAFTSKCAVLYHVISAMSTIGISLLTYYMLILCGRDPMWTVKLAFRWCQNVDEIHVSTTPMYTLIHSTANLLGWALCVTPAVARYRHYSRDRSLLIAFFASFLVTWGCRFIEENVDKSQAFKFYSSHFILNVLKPFMYLTLVPFLAKWPYAGEMKIKTK